MEETKSQVRRGSRGRDSQERRFNIFLIYLIFLVKLFKSLINIFKQTILYILRLKSHGFVLKIFPISFSIWFQIWKWNFIREVFSKKSRFPIHSCHINVDILPSTHQARLGTIRRNKMPWLLVDCYVSCRVSRRGIFN